MQLLEDCDTLVSLLGLAPGHDTIVLEVSNVPDSLSTVVICKVVLGFTEVLDCGLQSFCSFDWMKESC